MGKGVAGSAWRTELGAWGGAPLPQGQTHRGSDQAFGFVLDGSMKYEHLMNRIEQLGMACFLFL